MKVYELQGTALDWAVAKCEGLKVRVMSGVCHDAELLDMQVDGDTRIIYSADWDLAGPIIEREWLDITPWPNESREDMRWHCQQHDTANDSAQYGPTALIAAMRCYVASHFSDEIEVPDELMRGEKA